MNDKSKGAMVVATETIFKCVIEDKIYNIKDSQPVFVQFFRTFTVVPGQIAGGKGQLRPIIDLVPVCEKCFNDKQYHFEKPDEIEVMESFTPKEKVKTTIPDIPGLRKN